MTLKEYRKKLGMSRVDMARLFGIPVRTIENWDAGVRRPPEWAEELLKNELKKMEETKMKKVEMYLSWTPPSETIDGKERYNWHETRKWPDWEPYLIEVPEEFELREAKGGREIYFRGDCECGYELFTQGDGSYGPPVLVGGNPTECLILKVVGESVK